MLAEEWEQIKLVFEAALALPEDQRRAYVESACAEYPERKIIVLELLSNHAGAGRFLETVTVRIRHVFVQDTLVAGRFRIVRFIGDGGMGEVYEAFDERLKVRVALKTLRAELVEDPQALERFRREILVAREVSHENVCKIFDLVEHSDPVDGTSVPCLTMQLIEGESLLKYLQPRRPLPPEQALPLIRQIAGAIDALHRHGIIHRDLKPSNIMLSERHGELRAVVTDFGLARGSALAESATDSKAEGQAGAPYFMAPELLRNGKPSPASDIYAFGLIMDEMVTPSPAFAAGSLHSLYYQKLWETPAAPSARAANLGPQWDHVIMGCLAQEPGHRYQSAREAVRELEDPATAAVPPLPARSNPARRPFRFTRARVAILASVLAIAAGVAATKSMVEPIHTSLVVFPFENLSDRKDLGYLCKGIGAEVMRRLMLIDGVQVVPYYEPRSSAHLDQLKGRYSLEGLLQASENRVRLTAQLTDNRDGTLLWSQNFERDLQNPLQLQSDIAEGSVRALELHTLAHRPLNFAGGSFVMPAGLLRLFGFPRLAVPRAATASGAAFDYYMRGRSLFDERTVPAALDAIKAYEDALREDPNFALAKSGLAEAQFVLLDNEYEDSNTLVARARQYASDAIRLDAKLAEGHTVMAAVRESVWDFRGAEQSYKTAIQVNPRFARAHRWYAGLIIQYARFDEAMEEMRRSLELDPYDYPAQGNQGLFLYFAHKYREAASQLEQTLAHKELSSAQYALGDTYIELALASSGQERESYFARALEQADRLETVMRKSMAQSPRPRNPISIQHADRMHAEYYLLSGHPEKAQPYLARLNADTKAGRISPVNLGTIYSMLGDADRALPLLQAAGQYKDRQLLFIRVSPKFDRVRSDPRFQALMQEMGLI